MPQPISRREVPAAILAWLRKPDRPELCRTCGCGRDVHRHHPRDGYDRRHCGRCGKDACPAFRPDSNAWVGWFLLALVALFSITLLVIL